MEENKKEKTKTKKENEIITPVSLEEFSLNETQEEIENIQNIEKVQNIQNLETSNQNGNYSFCNKNQKGRINMINAVNPINQTVQPNANVIFTGSNVKTNACNSCCGWLNHNDNSGIFTIIKPGIYKINFNANVSPTVAGAITLNITNSGENIAGGEMNTAGTTVGTFENVAAEVLVRVPCNSSVVITVKDNTATNPITVSQPSLTITRVS